MTEDNHGINMIIAPELLKRYEVDRFGRDSQTLEKLGFNDEMEGKLFELVERMLRTLVRNVNHDNDITTPYKLTVSLEADDEIIM